jgi:hypothetical protein
MYGALQNDSAAVRHNSTRNVPLGRKLKACGIAYTSALSAACTDLVTANTARMAASHYFEGTAIHPFIEWGSWFVILPLVGALGVQKGIGYEPYVLNSFKSNASAESSLYPNEYEQRGYLSRTINNVAGYSKDLCSLTKSEINAVATASFVYSAASKLPVDSAAPATIAGLLTFFISSWIQLVNSRAVLERVGTSTLDRNKETLNQIVLKIITVFAALSAIDGNNIQYFEPETCMKHVKMLLAGVSPSTSRYTHFSSSSSTSADASPQTTSEHSTPEVIEVSDDNEQHSDMGSSSSSSF